jgi:hypothetical protein
VTVTEIGLMKTNRDNREIMRLQFSFTFADPFPAEAGTRYWISPESDSPTTQPKFFWPQGAANRAETRRDVSLIIEGSEISWLNAVSGLHTSGPGVGTRDRIMTLIGRPASDADEDGMDDAWETANGLNPSLADADADPDADGATNIQEFERESDPNDPDTDDDGLSDGVETNRGTYVDAANTGSSPLLSDTDRDGLIDSLEAPGSDFPSVSGIYPSDPNRADTDRDGYADAQSFPEPVVLGLGADRLLKNDLTDPDENGNPDDAEGYDAVFNASHNPGFQTFGAFNVFDNRLDEEEDEWAPPSNASGDFWVQATLNEPVVLHRFTVASGGVFSFHDPTKWEIQGSNDGGATFETIFHRDLRPSNLWTARSQVVQFDAGLHYPTPKAYSVIRFFSKPSNDLSVRTIQLGELELFGGPASNPLTLMRLEPVNVGEIRVVWTSNPGRLYTVEASTDLNNWSPVIENHPSEGATTSYVDPSGNDTLAPMGFYRVFEVSP